MCQSQQSTTGHSGVVPLAVPSLYRSSHRTFKRRSILESALFHRQEHKNRCSRQKADAVPAGSNAPRTRCGRSPNSSVTSRTTSCTDRAAALNRRSTSTKALEVESREKAHAPYLRVSPARASPKSRRRLTAPPCPVSSDSHGASFGPRRPSTAKKRPAPREKDFSKIVLAFSAPQNAPRRYHRRPRPFAPRPSRWFIHHRV